MRKERSVLSSRFSQPHNMSSGMPKSDSSHHPGLREGSDEGYLQGSPDLVIEILSRSQHLA